MIFLEQIGFVKEVIDDSIFVQLTRNSACGSNCEGCGAHCAESSIEIRKFKNTINAKKGDVVKFTMKDKSVLSFIGLVYGIPLLFLLAGTSIGYYILSSISTKNIDLYSFIIGIAFLLISSFVIRKLDNKFGNITANSILEKL